VDGRFFLLSETWSCRLQKWGCFFRVYIYFLLITIFRHHSATGRRQTQHVRKAFTHKQIMRNMWTTKRVTAPRASPRAESQFHTLLLQVQELEQHSTLSPRNCPQPDRSSGEPGELVHVGAQRAERARRKRPCQCRRLALRHRSLLCCCCAGRSSAARQGKGGALC
jgi:hypothetical protein